MYKVIDNAGNVWGHMLANSAAEAIQQVLDDAAMNPDAYMGQPANLSATAI